MKQTVNSVATVKRAAYLTLASGKTMWGRVDIQQRMDRLQFKWTSGNYIALKQQRRVVGVLRRQDDIWTLVIGGQPVSTGTFHQMGIEAFTRLVDIKGVR